MREKVIEFLEDFFQAESDAWKASDIADLESFNTKLDIMNNFCSNSMQNKFGMIPKKDLGDLSYYEEYKDFPAPEKRYLFRVDEFSTQSGEKIYKCFVSMSGPRRKKFRDIFIIENIQGKLKIAAKFFITDNGMGNGYWWNSAGGDEKYEHKIEGEFKINQMALGEKISEHRIIEPENNEEEMLVYNRE